MAQVPLVVSWILIRRHARPVRVNQITKRT